MCLLDIFDPLTKSAAVAEWYRHRIVAGFVTSSSPVPLKTRRVGQRCTLNLSRAEMSSCWCGVVARRGGCQLSAKGAYRSSAPRARNELKPALRGSQKRKILKEKEYNINSKDAKLENFLILPSTSSCASNSNSSAKEHDE
ncbi:uncharacterized protein TNCV_3001061 [Trichonephila clavipes]|nr:uncharacterized protein TNCV_3001061 [Trichonephila clavipes]